MIRWLIAWCVRNRLLVCLLTLMLGAAGLWAMLRLPVDAIPDLSDVQVIVYSQWMGRDPQTVEDQVTYPLTTKMLAVPGAKVVRGYSFFGFSLVYVIFEDGTDLYWARSRVLEYLSDMQGRLPEGVVTSLGPDATGVGWVYEYTLENGRYCPRHPQGLFRPRGEAGPYWEEPPAGIETELVRAWLDRERCPLDGTELVRAEYDLGELRALQDWYLRYPLTAVPGVAEVASLGGYERQYQVTVEPSRLQTYGLPLRRVIEAIRRSNNDVGGRLLEIAETEYMVRGRGYLRSLADLEQIPLGVSPQGTPILLRDVATVALGPEVRRGLAEKDGRGQVVAGIVVMRWGENALATIERVKAKLEELQRGLPPGVGVFTAYDRSALIHRAIATLRRQLLEEMAIVALVCVVFLWHARSALVAAVTLPLGILISLLAMVALGINANIMSLGGIAIAIGAMVDASVVLVENAHKRLHERPQEDRWQVIVRASQEVGPALFFSLLVITVSFLPVFALQAQAGRLFKPLAYTKTFAMAAAALLAVTIIPVATALFVRHSLWPAGWSRARGWGVGLVLALGPVLAANLLAPALGWRWWLEQRLVWSAGWLVVAALLLVPQRIRREEDNPLSRLLIRLYMPVIRAVLRHPWAVIAGALLVLAASWLPYRRLGSEFMPPLDEGDILYMPTAVPGISIAAAETTLQIQDQLFKQFPEVDVVLGKIGRAETPTDPAPLTMVETTVTLYPPERWPARKLVEGQLAEPLAELLAAFGPLPARYARDAAAEVEKMALAEFNPRLRRACLEGRALAEAAAELLPELMRFAREQAVAAYRDKLLQWRKERLRAELAAALAAEPLGVRGRLDAGGALVLERQRLAERLGRLHAGAEGAVSELVAHLQEQLAQADDPAAFAAGLEQRLVELVREELPEYLARQGLVRAELDEAALARHLEDALRPERLGPLRLRRGARSGGAHVPGDGSRVPVPGPDQRLDHADQDPDRHAGDRDQDPDRHQGLRSRSGGAGAARDPDRGGGAARSRYPVGGRRAGVRRQLPRRRDRPRRLRAPRADRRRGAGRDRDRDRRHEHHADGRGSVPLQGECALSARAAGRSGAAGAGAGRHPARRTDPARAAGAPGGQGRPARDQERERHADGDRLRRPQRRPGRRQLRGAGAAAGGARGGDAAGVLHRLERAVRVHGGGQPPASGHRAGDGADRAGAALLQLRAAHRDADRAVVAAVRGGGRGVAVVPARLQPQHRGRGRLHRAGGAGG
ncbi:MAG: hypothetical protein KatS3mg102_2342 [Planctomycetota bacterium]|nr:MAG: hypothetical protein KatS3mg102_2342 [Planctomycetota bacterium]